MIGVYIARDVYGDPLYIGSSLDIDGRLSQHRSQAEWWPEMYEVETRPTETRAEAYHLERRLILELLPKHNRRGHFAPRVLSRATGPVVKPNPQALARVIADHGSVAELAKAVGCNHQTMSTIWRGVSFPSSRVIARLLIASGMSFDELFYVEDANADQEGQVSA